MKDRHLLINNCLPSYTVSVHYEVILHPYLVMTVVAVAGRTGQLGRAIVEEIFQRGGQEVPILAREVLSLMQCYSSEG
jgi:hypothetical protein